MGMGSSSVAWAKVAVAGVVLHAILFGTLHVLEPQLGLFGSIISDYTATSSGWLATAAFLAFAAIWGALALAVSPVSSGRGLLQAGRGLFALAVLGIVVGALLPETADPRTPSMLSRLQNLIARPGLFLGILLVSVGLLRVPGWRGVARKLTALGTLAFGLLIVTIAVLLARDLGGIGQRAVFIALYVWVLVLARRIMAHEPGDGGRPRRAERATPNA